MKTYVAKKEDIQRKWFVVDATDKILGRLAVKVAVILRGKNKVIFTPHVNVGDGVIVINAAKIRVTGRKMEQKEYRRYSGYPGGLKVILLKDMLQNRPTTVIKLAVSRMLPQGPLGRDIIKQLRVYAGAEYPHSAQKPVVLDI